VPTARHFVAANGEEARKILSGLPWDSSKAGSGWVVKADGLALGKGVRVCGELKEALEAVGEFPGEWVIEEKLQGEELSWLAFCDGESCCLFEPARDYKTLFEAGWGPNTGGMGAFSPVPGVPENWPERAREEIFLPVLREMKKRGTPFRGVLYAGLMCDFAHDRFWVLEFNARFGDPEAQVLLARMDGDLWEWCDALAHGRLAKMPSDVPMRREAAVIVITAAAGYPGRPEKGRVISGLDWGSPNSREVPTYFAAGISRTGEGKWLTSGGRVLGAMGMAGTLEGAREQAYARAERISFTGMQFRRDIVGSSGSPS